MDNLHIEGHFDTITSTVSYLVLDRATLHCALVDSVLDYDPKSGRTSTRSADHLIARVQALGATVQWILETHAHADHLSAAPYLKQKLGGRIAIGEHIRQVQQVFGKLFNAGTEFEHDGSQFDHLFTDGETFRIGQLQARVMHTPGHTPACVTYVVEEDGQSAAFVGDTLFMPDYGTARCDFPGGDARQLFRSINAVLSLPPQTRLFMSTITSRGAANCASRPPWLKSASTTFTFAKGSVKRHSWPCAARVMPRWTCRCCCCLRYRSTCAPDRCRQRKAMVCVI